jgi:hypothetical protein
MRRQQFDDLVNLANQFRCAAVSLVYSITVVLVSGFAPPSLASVSWLIAATGISIAPIFYISEPRPWWSCLLSFVTALVSRRTE